MPLYRYKSCPLCDKMVHINCSSIKEIKTNIPVIYHMSCIDSSFSKLNLISMKPTDVFKPIKRVDVKIPEEF
jgi:hypothetical protein